MKDYRIHFIGTAHHDQEGEERLEGALGYEKPDILTVECSNELVDFLENEGIPRIFQKIDSLNFSDAEAVILKNRFQKLNFEISTSKDYALQHNLPLHYVDHYSLVQGSKRDVSVIELLSKEKMATLLVDTSKKEIKKTDAIYSFYQKLFDSFPQQEQQEMNRIAHNFSHRDAFMASKVLGLIEADAKLVHVGGIGHCLKDAQERTLFSKLSKYNPTRATLKWYDGK